MSDKPGLVTTDPEGWFDSGGHWVWYLASRPLRIRICSGPTIIDPVSGNRAGIQTAPRVEVESLWPSSKCPICLREYPHAHCMAELTRMREMVAYLEQKLGVSK